MASRWFARPSGTTQVTTTLVMLNIGLFIADKLTGGELTYKYSMQPDAIGNGGEWWRFLTAAFLHAGLLHIASNMIALWSIGQPIEQLLGRNRFLTLYLFSALGGSIASYTFSSVMTQSVGASGAIFGLLTAFIVLGRRSGFDVTNALMLLVINIAIGFSPGIDWRAHLGGGVVGAATTLVLVGTRRSPQRNENQVTYGLAFIVVVMLVLYFVRTKAIREGVAL